MGFRLPAIHQACHEAVVSKCVMLITCSNAAVALVICEASLRVVE
jgi:hypothetical protein